MLGIGMRGEPWEFRRRSLLLRADSIWGCEEGELVAPGVTEGGCCADRVAEPVALPIEMIAGFGLKDTFRDPLL